MNSNLTPLLLLAVAVALFYVYINPTYAHIGELEIEKAKYEEALSQAGEIQAIREDLLSRYNGFSEEDLARLETLLPDSVNNVRLVLDIDGIASTYGISIRNIKVDRGRTGNAEELNSSGSGVKPYNSVEISFAFEASYGDFVNFTRDLEQSLRIIDVSNISFQPSAGGQYEYVMTIQTYWLK